MEDRPSPVAPGAGSDPEGRRRARHRLAVAALAVGVIAAGAAARGLWWNRGRAAPAAEPPPGRSASPVAGVGSLEPEPEPAPAGPAAASEAEEIHDLCERIGATLASVGAGECERSGLRLSAGRSVEGTPIAVREFPPQPSRPPLGRVLVVGGIHGDEYSSVSIVFKWIDLLDRHHSGLFHWRIAPLMNPDGLFGRPARRMNAHGVDLNRNFPSPNWQEEAPTYWVRDTSRNPRRYPGPLPLSEPESRWLFGEIESFRPMVIVSVHAPFNVVDFDGPPEPPQRLGPLGLKLLGTYPGSLGRFAGVHRRIQVVTIELPRAGVMPTEDEQARIWRDLVGWLRGELRQAAGAADPTAQLAPPRAAAAGG